MNRIYPEKPMLAIGVVVFEKEQVILIKRGQPPEENTWSLPGGLVEIGEPLVEACRREVKEETGLDINCKDALTIFDRIELDDKGRVKYHYVIIDFWGEAVGGLLKAGSDVSDARAVNVYDFDGLDITNAVRETINKACKVRMSSIYPMEKSLPVWP